MEAGRELDARIDAEIYGVDRKMCPIHHSFNCCGSTMSHYSTSIVDAMPLFDKMIEKVGVARIIRYAPKGREPYWEIEWRYRGARVREQTLELAICAFALAVSLP